jgi:hypothetical protein
MEVVVRVAVLIERPTGDEGLRACGVRSVKVSTPPARANTSVEILVVMEVPGVKLLRVVADRTEVKITLR